ncbi:hypothetical protein [Vibrio cyclitrophicus]|uniref:DUF7674 family protein n=1 Tax=Vibrio cyclitrophicus TaxID=47951 RepID=UPI000C82B075|nr:hypothetical protein [Vibrio cyclitrophicus]PME43969.1 hypothetical protein BCV36_08800 [Vibrio cyclitrophicus]PMF34057.1 hypothetical protein BCV15_10590 [Vibrio cyclitrophicus]
MLDRSSLLRELKEQFPELTPLINVEQGLLVFEVEAFYKYTQSLINDGHVEKVKLCFSIANKYLINGNQKVRSAIATSYAECLDFNDTKKLNRSWAWELYPKPLKKEYAIVRGELGI